MKTLTIAALAVIAGYIGFGVALNSAADVAMRLWGQSVQAQTAISQPDGQTVYLNYQLQRTTNPQQPANVVFEATPSHQLQP